MKKQIVLIGMMGSGKTTVGKQLAEILDWTFIDLDEEIEKRENKKYHKFLMIMVNSILEKKKKKQ